MNRSRKPASLSRVGAGRAASVPRREARRRVEDRDAPFPGWVLGALGVCVIVAVYFAGYA